jgi:UDP-3-O-[3-hydroxymyristoyl] glucosamine N-acyltransferase
VGFEGWERRSAEAGALLEDEVEIGPQTVVERGLERDTRISAGAILGGQVYVGHDCQVGRHCLIMAQCALGGRSTIGDYTTLMARVAVNPGVRIGRQVLVLGGSSVYGHIADGSKVFGVPARPHREGLRALATPSVVRSLQRRVAELEDAGRPAKSKQ